MVKAILANEISGFFDQQHQQDKLAIYHDLRVEGKYFKKP